jgi:hypothetical protein
MTWALMEQIGLCPTSSPDGKGSGYERQDKSGNQDRADDVDKTICIASRQFGRHLDNDWPARENLSGGVLSQWPNGSGGDV